jgi:L-threonylcarbamoyladenylate synthase
MLYNTLYAYNNIHPLMPSIIPFSHIAEHYDEIVGALRAGAVMLYPTDTQYGLGSLARNPEAVANVNAVKHADTAKPLSIIVQDTSAISRYVHVSQEAQRLIDTYLPGALTLVLPAKDTELARSTGSEKGIGVRVPDTSGILELVRRIGDPITTTSANIHGTQPKTTCTEILRELSGIDIAIDAGDLGSVPSTMVHFPEKDSDDFTVLRQGVIHIQQ